MADNAYDDALTAVRAVGYKLAGLAEVIADDENCPKYIRESARKLAAEHNAANEAREKALAAKWS